VAHYDGAALLVVALLIGPHAVCFPAARQLIPWALTLCLVITSWLCAPYLDNAGGFQVSLAWNRWYYFFTSGKSHKWYEYYLSRLSAGGDQGFPVTAFLGWLLCMPAVTIPLLDKLRAFAAMHEGTNDPPLSVAWFPLCATLGINPAVWIPISAGIAVNPVLLMFLVLPVYGMCEPPLMRRAITSTILLFIDIGISMAAFLSSGWFLCAVNIVVYKLTMVAFITFMAEQWIRRRSTATPEETLRLVTPRGGTTGRSGSFFESLTAGAPKVSLVRTWHEVVRLQQDMATSFAILQPLMLVALCRVVHQRCCRARCRPHDSQSSVDGGPAGESRRRTLKKRAFHPQVLLQGGP